MATKYGVQTGIASVVTSWGTLLTGSAHLFTNGSANVVGTGTSYTTELAVNDYIIGKDSVWYQVLSITDNTHLTLTTNYTGTTGSIVSYKQVTAVPAEGDKVYIGDALNFSPTITVDGTYIWGDDSTTGIVIKAGATLKASRTANSDLTCKGTLTNTEALGVFDWGYKDSDPIPSGVSAIVRFNYSSSITAGKYSYTGAAISKTYISGETRTKWTQLNGGIAVGATSAVVDNCTGWAVGDIIVFMASDGTYSHDDNRTISTIDTGTKTITFAATTYAHADDMYVGNFSHNVIMRSHTTGNGKQGGMLIYCTQTTGEVDLRNFACQYLGGNGGYSIYMDKGINYQTTAFDSIKNISFYEYYNATSALYLYSFAGFYGGTTKTIDNCIAYSTGTVNASNSFIYTANNTLVTFNNCVCFRNQGGAAITTGNGLGGYNCIWNNCVFCTGNPTIAGAGNDWTFNDCYFFLPQTTYSIVVTVGGDWYFNRCYFGKNPSGTGTLGTTSVTYLATNYDIRQIFVDCHFNYSGAFQAGTAYQYLALDQAKLIVNNKNAVATTQEIYTGGGNFFRDTSVYKSGTNSIRYEGITSCGKYGFLQFNVMAPNAKPVTVSGFLRKNSNYGSTYRPYVTLTGMGITTSTYTMTDVNDTWEQFTVSGTNNTGADGVFTLTTYFQSSSTSGYAYLNGISAPTPVAVNTGEFGYWSLGQPVKDIIANYVAPIDVWNVQTSDCTTTGSQGKQANDVKALAGIIPAAL